MADGALDGARLAVDLSSGDTNKPSWRSSATDDLNLVFSCFGPYSQAKPEPRAFQW